MNVPQTYYEWVQILNIIKAGTQDNEALAVLCQGKLEHQAGVYERFVNRLTQTINTRFVMALDNFQKALNQNQFRKSHLPSPGSHCRRYGFNPPTGRAPGTQG